MGRHLPLLPSSFGEPSLSNQPGLQLMKNQSLDSLHLEGFNLTHKGQWWLTNQGHSVVLQVGNGMQVSGGGLPGTYRTIQLHFHWVSYGGLGLHVTQLALLLIFHLCLYFIVNTLPQVTYLHNENFQSISNALLSVAYKGQTKSIRPFPLMNLLPQNNLTQYYRYHGSLTTPPCSHCFELFVSGICSTEEEADKQVPLQNNYRHIHPTYVRPVYASKDAKLLTNGVSPLAIFNLFNVLLYIGFLNI
uniref:Carbonic anhydrase 15 n=1 Tax=Sinocyclocheilus rhinocerous TaxID=307959 RepID=A0A673KZD0_9TELE